MGSGVVWRLDDDDCCASAFTTFKLVFVADGVSTVWVVASASMWDDCNAGETDLDGIEVLLSIDFGEILILRSSIGSVDAGRLSLSLGSSGIGEYDRPISIECADASVLLDVVGGSSICCSFRLASICFESFVISSVYEIKNRKI